MEDYIFPFEKVKRGAKIAIYGAGEVGQAYVKQVVETGFCSLLCVADRQKDCYCSNGVKLIEPEHLVRVQFDCLVIAIKKKMVADAIIKDLQESFGISSKKILWVNPLRFLYDGKNYIMENLPIGAAAGCKGISIAVYLGAGFGDAVIGKKVIDTMVEEAGECCLVDIYVRDVTYTFVRGLFSISKFVKNVYKATPRKYGKLCSRYDLAFTPLYIFSLDHFDENALRDKQPRFAELISRLAALVKESGLSNSHLLDNGILFARAQRRKCNAYTVHSFGGLLPIVDTKVYVPLMEEFEETYRALVEEGKTFITVNYGWGANAHGEEVVPAKIWPLKHYEQLISMIKSKYPTLQIIQIGRGNSPRLKLTDCFLQDIHIEVIKYVLRDALLHIDSEGGMVHLATQLGTKCLVAFGPTPIFFFGYDNNINVLSGKCSNCFYLDADFTKCIRGMKEPECMYSLLPEMMFKKFEEYMKDKKGF